MSLSAHTVQFRPLGHRQSFRVAGPDKPPYAEALERYYQQGPPGDWQMHFVSAYSTMHPWEDWTETFALYLDMVASLDTADHLGFLDDTTYGFDAMVEAFRRLRLMMNEMNRTMGLVDLVPELLVGPVVEKMRHVDALVRQVQQAEAPLAAAMQAPLAGRGAE